MEDPTKYFSGCGVVVVLDEDNVNNSFSFKQLE